MKTFTVEEANALLPLLRPRVEALLKLRGEILHHRSEVLAIVEGAEGEGGSRSATEMADRFRRMQMLVESIQRFGVVVRDVNSGLIDFPAERHGQRVYLCWQYGEPRILYWHEEHVGYAGRRSIEEW
ncbi:hypothetical protein ARMA_2688 [Ardenticatena maritima]|uniref:DUF2203 domain-containing protein n=1 Tax=Ardenticatena maritima TaxID=872965 RepID=A0A0M8K941_9CHLR|nr:DUF2203 domain-containing protein [Ardenticatena maritima]KPL89348.1 hypothetical protein SE16_02485 [Ardenticatena maritima]GAP64265.1 hypothetical protein ARMA_2688 [Ardenticatena maritima]